MNTDHRRGYLRYPETQPAKVKEFISASRTSLRGCKPAERNNVSFVRKKSDTTEIRTEHVTRFFNHTVIIPLERTVTPAPPHD